jgi:glycogen debranching enzyme
MLSIMREQEGMQNYQALLNEAKAVLQRNTITVAVDGKRYERVIPSRDYYVHQWLWDSAGIAMGLVHVNEEAAFNELVSLVAGQWNNGLIPHIIYNPDEARYYPPSDQWQTTRFTRHGIKTSGITDPPLLAIAAEYLCAHSSNEQRKRDFIKTILPSLMAYHDYLKRYRDPEECGLLTIVHPWESGTDDSPRWDSILKRIELSSIPANIKDDVDRNRKDIRFHPSEERPTEEDYYRYIYLIELFKELSWDYTKIVEQSPFAVKDILFNSIWQRANEALARLLHTYGNQEEADKYQQWAVETQKALTNTWDQAYNQYCDIDVTQGNHRAIAVPTNAIFMPLYAGAVTDQQLDILLHRLSQTDEFSTAYPVPSTAINCRYFDKDRYWRGPTWPITNFFIIEGLKKYKTRHNNIDQQANFLTTRTIQMIKDSGFWEYFDPIEDGTKANEKGMGFSSFSWTAAILIQLLNRTNLTS